LLAKEIRFFFNEFKDLFMSVNSLHCFWFELKGFFYSNDVASRQAVSTALSSLSFDAPLSQTKRQSALILTNKKLSSLLMNYE
jgi:hypothetical protein